MTYQQHPLSAAFPAMSDEDFLALQDSIENIGVQNPITLFEGMVIDGWHRYKAATNLGVDCPTVELDDVDPRDFVLAQNRARRHITQAQLALATTAVYRWHPSGWNQHAESQSKTSESRVGSACPPSKTTAELAAISGVGERTIKQAKAVQKSAAPEVIEAVKRGDIGLEKASAIAKLPKEEQASAINKPIIKQAEPANDDLSPDLAELVDELQAENELLREQVEAMSKDDQKAETLKYIKLYDHAKRQQEVEMDKAHRAAKREKRLFLLLTRCGKQVGETDPDKIPAAVEAMAKTKRVA